VDTLRRPDIRKPSIRLRELLADALLIAGFVQMVLGIYEIGGLFNLGVGFAVVWAGALAVFADMTRNRRDEEEAFFRITDNM
jgi:hypothetical protein